MARLERWIAAVVVISGLASLTSCTQARRSDIPHDAQTGGQTFDEMTAAVSEIPGIAVEVSGGDPPNIKGNTGYEIAVTVQPGYRVIDGPALISFLTESAWSVREGYMPNTQIAIGVTDNAGSDFDAAAAAAEAGLLVPQDPVKRSTAYSLATIGVEDDSLAREKLGDWPGDVPTVPTDVTAAK